MANKGVDYPEIFEWIPNLMSVPILGPFCSLGDHLVGLNITYLPGFLLLLRTSRQPQSRFKFKLCCKLGKGPKEIMW